MVRERKQYKALNFDFMVSSLRDYYPGRDYRKAYLEIKQFLEQNGFEHRQWSGYISEKPLYPRNITALIVKMKSALPWLSECVRRFDVTNIGKQYDLTGIIKSDAVSVLMEKDKSKPAVRDFGMSM